jgi:hypothetical protein
MNQLDTIQVDVLNLNRFLCDHGNIHLAREFQKEFRAMMNEMEKSMDSIFAKKPVEPIGNENVEEMMNRLRLMSSQMQEQQPDKVEISKFQWFISFLD